MKQLPFVVIVFFLAGCDLCDNSLRKESSSPSGEAIASVFLRNCGATTPFITVVTMRNVKSKLNMNKHENWVFTAHDESDIELSWETEEKLLIKYSTYDTKPTKRSQWRSVAVIFERK